MITVPKNSMSSASSTDLPQGAYIKQWTQLSPGDHVEVVAKTGRLTHASVDTVAESGEVIWLRDGRSGQRTLHLADDPIELYLTP